jgi:hypothetical protein
VAGAVAVGQLVILLPQWGQLVFGIPAILLVYGWIIWTRGFGPEDRVLFARKVGVTEPAPDPRLTPEDTPGHGPSTGNRPIR